MVKKEKTFPHKKSSIFILIKIVFYSGFLFLVISLVYHSHLINRLSFSKSIPPAVNIYNVRTSMPAGIRIGKVNIDLPIFETSIVDNTWEIASDGASHLDISGRPGENNTIIVYGHNTNNRFGSIRWLKIGDSIEVTSKDDNIYSYVITDIKEVNSDETDILTSQKDETLILYTCVGFADLKRYVVVAKLRQSPLPIL